MYPWYRDSVGGQLGQLCGPMATTIKTENGYNDCMLALDYATQSKVSFVRKLSFIPNVKNSKFYQWNQVEFIYFFISTFSLAVTYFLREPIRRSFLHHLQCYLVVYGWLRLYFFGRESTAASRINSYRFSCLPLT